MISTVFIHQKLFYYFSLSEEIDLEIGRNQGYSMANSLNLLEETNIVQRQRTIQILCAALSLENILIGQSTDKFVINDEAVKQFIDAGGLKISLFGLQNLVGQLSTKNVGINQQMTIKTLFNLFYIGLYYTFDNKQKQKDLYEQTRKFLKQIDIDSFLIKLITMSLQIHYLPVKKIVVLYARVLSMLFDIPDFYHESDFFELASKNLLPEQYLAKYKETNNPKDISNTNCAIKQFYAKHNVGDCPLAQSVVVGLLRSLLTICNSQMHKKFSMSSSGSGVDSYREWQITYQFLQINQTFKKGLSEKSMKMIDNYRKYNEEPNNKEITHHEFYSHKIYTTSAISVFFSFLLFSFKKSVLIHFTYLYQLISDANGILVFLKFLTDKFDSMQVPEIYRCKNRTVSFENQIMLAVYSVLLILYGACNNYPEKARNYLFEYNSYLIIKKIPHLFMKSHKNDQQLPSNKQIQEQFGQIQKMNPITRKVKQLTVLCYDLLKIQIPFFSKKSKDSSSNMRMIVQIYCQLPKNVKPIERNTLDKILLKNKMKKTHIQKYIRSIEELKTVHNDYNNHYYWANQVLDKNRKETIVAESNQLQISKEGIQQWLENNVWRYFD